MLASRSKVRKKVLLLSDEGSQIRYEIGLARALSMTRGELRMRMDQDEFVWQIAYDEVAADEAKHEAARAEVKQAVRTF